MATPPGVHRGAEARADEARALLPWLAGPASYPLLLGLAAASYIYSRPGPGFVQGSGGSLFVVNFLFFTGGGVGAIIVSVVASAVRLERARPIARIAELAAINCLVLAMIFMALDLPGSARAWSLSRPVRPVPWLLWDGAVITIYLADMMSLGYLAIRADVIGRMAAVPAREWISFIPAFGRIVVATSTVTRERRALRQLAAIFVPGAILLHSIPTWVLGHLGVEPGWITVLLSPSFMLSSGVAGLALVLLAATVSRVLPHIEVGDDAMRALGRILLVALAPYGYCLLIEMQVGLLTHQPAALQVFHEITVGPSALVFWFVFLSGVVGPFLLLWVRRSGGANTIGLAALLVVLGMLAERWIVAIAPLLGHAHGPNGPGGYTPGSGELLPTVGAYAIGVLIYLFLAARVFPREPRGPFAEVDAGG